MRCSKARDNLNLQLDAQLPPDATVDLRLHLDDCSACRAYHDDLLHGRRLLAATEPVLPENFDWKLQLRLNQVLRERAAETAYPWDEPVRDRWHWWRNFGAATSVGMAAVLALAVFFGPVSVTWDGGLPSDNLAATARTAGQADRASLTLAPVFSGAGVGRPVADSAANFSSRSGGTNLDLGWSGDRMEDLRTIQRLRVENRQLYRSVVLYQSQLHRLQGQLDTTRVHTLDLEGSR